MDSTVRIVCHISMDDAAESGFSFAGFAWSGYGKDPALRTVRIRVSQNLF